MDTITTPGALRMTYSAFMRGRAATCHFKNSPTCSENGDFEY